MSNRYQCAQCGIQKYRLYRPYGEFFREERVFCKAHIPEHAAGWYVPLIENSDGSVWGYMSCPPESVQQWKSYPEVETDRNDVDYWPWTDWEIYSNA